MAMSSALGALAGIGGLLGGSSPEELEKYQKERDKKNSLAEDIVNIIAANGMTVADATEVLYVALGLTQKAANSRPLSEFVGPPKKEIKEITGDTAE